LLPRRDLHLAVPEAGFGLSLTSLSDSRCQSSATCLVCKLPLIHPGRISTPWPPVPWPGSHIHRDPSLPKSLCGCIVSARLSSEFSSDSRRVDLTSRMEFAEANSRYNDVSLTTLLSITNADVARLAKLESASYLCLWDETVSPGFPTRTRLLIWSHRILGR